LFTGFFFLYGELFGAAGVTKFHPCLSGQRDNSGNFGLNWQLSGNGTGNDTEENGF
jgi:hypothetical protein